MNPEFFTEGNEGNEEGWKGAAFEEKHHSMNHDARATERKARSGSWVVCLAPLCSSLPSLPSVKIVPVRHLLYKLVLFGLPCFLAMRSAQQMPLVYDATP